MVEVLNMFCHDTAMLQGAVRYPQRPQRLNPKLDSTLRFPGETEIERRRGKGAPRFLMLMLMGVGGVGGSAAAASVGGRGGGSGGSGTDKGDRAAMTMVLMCDHVVQLLRYSPRKPSQTLESPTNDLQHTGKTKKKNARGSHHVFLHRKWKRKRGSDEMRKLLDILYEELYSKQYRID